MADSSLQVRHVWRSLRDVTALMHRRGWRSFGPRLGRGLQDDKVAVGDGFE